MRRSAEKDVTPASRTGVVVSGLVDGWKASARAGARRCGATE